MEQSLKLGDTNYHFKLVKVQNVAGTAPYWKAWTQGVAQGHLNITQGHATFEYSYSYSLLSTSLLYMLKNCQIYDCKAICGTI